MCDIKLESLRLMSTSPIYLYYLLIFTVAEAKVSRLSEEDSLNVIVCLISYDLEKDIVLFPLVTVSRHIRTPKTRSSLNETLAFQI